MTVWRVADLKLTRNCQKLVVASLDGVYIFIYSTYKNLDDNNHPIQKFCRHSKPSTFYHPIEIVEIDADDLNFKLELIIVSSSCGAAYIFKMY